MNPPDKKPPLRVSDWGEPTSIPAPAPAPSMAAPTSPVAATSAPSAATAAAPAAEGVDLPIDPWRFLGGLWKRRHWVAIATAVGFAGGLVFALVRTQTRYQVSAQLIKRDIPTAFRAGEIGEAFKPRTLSSATLVGLAGSTNVLSRVAERATPPVSLGLLRRSIEVAEQRGTDYLYLTYSGYESAAATVDITNLWANEVVDYTREMQSRESREIRQYLQQQLDTTQTELQRVSKSLLEFSQKQGLVNVEKQIDAYLRSIGDLDLRYDTARLEIDATDVRLRNLETELTRQSPLGDELKTAREALATARTRYTDTNPIVLEARERVDQLTERLTASQQSTDTDLSRFAGTFLGNTLYLQILELKSQREALTGSVTELAKLRDAAHSQLKALPEKELAIAQLARNRQSLENTRDLLSSRLREAQMFEERAPGYYQLFAPATPEAVITSAKLIKVVAYALVGLVLGCGGGLALGLGIELLDPRLRTGAEAAKAWRAPLFAVLPAPGPPSKSTPENTPPPLDEIAARLWNRWLGDSVPGAGLPVIWSPQPHESENALWQGLLAEAGRLKPDLMIVDTGDVAACPAALAALPRVDAHSLDQPGTGLRRISVPAARLSLDEAVALVASLRQAHQRGRALWLRLAGPVREPLTSLARAGAAPLIVVPCGAAKIPEWREKAAQFRVTVGTPGGVVATGEVPWHER